MKFCKKNIVRFNIIIEFCFKMNNNRPLSPHLSIYRKVFTAVFSIFHRFTGIGLSLGSILITIWISMLALGPNYFFIFESVSNNIFFKLIMFIWTLGLFYHLFNGIRYLIWSFGWAMDLNTVYFSGYIVVILTFLSTLFVWLI